MFDFPLPAVITGGIFRKILNNQKLTLIDYNLLTTSLMAENIPFDVAFSSHTRSQAASLQLTIHINPSLTMVLVIELEPGSSAFSPSPS